MKRIFGILVMSAFIGGGAFAQTPSFSSVEGSFQNFANDVAPSLPYASTIGLNWSWAYIGNLPHFGVGLAAGFVTLPTTGFNDVANTLGVASTLPSPFNDPNLGLPLPAYVAEARIGGIILPFDLGIKVGFIPQQVDLGGLLPANTSIDFRLYGAQLRYALVKEKILRPAVSLGVGINHFEGTLGVSTGSNIQVASVPYSGGSYNVSLSAPQLQFHWNSTSLDASIEVSKHILLLLTPYIGAGLSYGMSSAGGGLNSTLLINGIPATQSQLDQINQYLAANGQSTINFSSTGFSILSKVKGFSARAFGGLSVNILFLKVDLTGMYNIMTKKLGATVGMRLQF